MADARLPEPPDRKKSGAGNPEIWTAFFALWLLFYALTCYLLEVFTVFVLFAVAFAGVVALVLSGLAFARLPAPCSSWVHAKKGEACCCWSEFEG